MQSKPLHQATVDLYRDAARNPDDTLCCVSTPSWRLPGLTIPRRMEEMNYGCGSVARPSDVAQDSTVLYIGVGAGLEVLQFAYLTRRPGGVIGVDVVEEMLDRCRDNLVLARMDNEWLEESFVDLRHGDATALPLESGTVDVVAQNCLFNIFEDADLRTALLEAHRVLRPGGRLLLSDPICEAPIADKVRRDPQLRAACLSGAVPMAEYLTQLVSAGFGAIEVRSRRPYRALTPTEHGVDQPTLLETVEVAAIHTPIPDDGPCVFTGRTATWIGDAEFLDDGAGHSLRRNIPLEVCDKTASALAATYGDEILLTPSSWHYGGGGCC